MRIRLLATLVVCAWIPNLHASRVQGTINYTSNTLTLNGFGSQTQRPVRFATLEIVNVDLGTTTAANTNADGQFDVDVGTWGLGTRVGIILHSENQAATVTDNLGVIYRWSTTGSPQVMTSDPFPMGTLTISEDEDAGALNILDVITSGYEYVRERSSPPLPPVHVEWRRDWVASCFTCYFGDTIRIGNAGSNRIDDTDEFDDSVVLHEYGHHFQAHRSCVGEGGAHSSCLWNQSPTLSWSEGSATYFSVLTGSLDPHIDQVSTNYLDSVGTFQSGSQIAIREDLENNEGCTDGFGPDGATNESAVERVLWDLQDNVDDGMDTYHRSERDVFDLIERMGELRGCDLGLFVSLMCGTFAENAASFAGVLRQFNVRSSRSCPPEHRRAARR